MTDKSRKFQVEKNGIEFHKVAAIAACNGAAVTPYHVHPPILPPHLQDKEISHRTGDGPQAWRVTVVLSLSEFAAIGIAKRL
eukprot:9011250-Pyramimonas_sp.AAC.1